VTSGLRLLPHLAGPAAGSVIFDSAVQFSDQDQAPVRAPDAHGLAGHLDAFGGCPDTAGSAGEALLDAIAETGLTGRGGAQFPVARKWQSYLRAGGHGVLVGNAAESEPLSRKDAALLQLRPHLVIDGLVATARAVGAEDIVLWMHESSHVSRRAITLALAERAARLPDEPAVRIALGPAGYLTGESSAVVQALSGGPALPSFRLTPSAVSGVAGRPTLLHNVETLARIGLAARGIVAETSLLTIACADRLIVLESAASTTLTHAIRLGGVDGPVPAALVGGYGGRWLQLSTVAELPLNHARFAEHGLSLGAGVIRPVRADECGLGVASEIAGYLADQSARQCGPCLFGLPAVADLLVRLVDGQARRRDLALLERFSGEITGRGACSHPDAAVGMIASALDTFADDVVHHLGRGRCRHG
jgi:NADH:ubiquinone oxidoreductase subunit F (NADH-binding)